MLMKPHLVFLAVIAAVFAASANANPGQNEKIRSEYNGTANTPNHLVFAAKLRHIEFRNAESPDIAMQIIRRRIGLYEEGAAEAFLEKMLTAASDLSAAQKKLEKNMLCNASLARSKVAIYKKLDALDDGRENKSHNAYIKFMSELDEKETTAFVAWLDKSKEGFYYRTAEHQSLYENSSYDVKMHVEQLCASLEGELS